MGIVERLVRRLARVMTAPLGAAVLVMLAWGPASADKDLRYPPDRPRAEPAKPKGDDADATVHYWRGGLEGKIYYLRSPRIPLLANDAVVIKRAKIRYFYPYDDGHTSRRYRVTLWFEGVAPAPPQTFRLEVEVIETLDQLNEWLANEFSTRPLESDFGWPSAIQQMIRTRFVAAGMTSAMVDLILGGLDHRVERGTLEDGSVREVWRIENSRRSRKACSARRDMNALPPPDGVSRTPAPGMGDETSGFYLFDHCTDEGLSIIFVDGQVVPARP